MKILISLLLTGVVILTLHCTKSVGKNPALAYTDAALLDSAKAGGQHYYKNDPMKLLSGANGPHGPFKLRFNAIAFKALQDSGSLPVKKLMPDGSLVVKDVYDNGQVSLYAIMYKLSGSWLWAEIKPSGEVHYSVNKDPGVCINCHSQAGNRDLLRTFSYY
ncbi:MAG: hypothetical protein V4635_17795 [Bacteroidota bacterium]